MSQPATGDRDKKKTALGCGCLGLLALVVIGGIGAALDDGDKAKDDKPAAAKSSSPSTTASASRSASPTPATVKSTSPSVVKVKLPDFTGQGLQAAQDSAQELGFYRLKSHDISGLDRFQTWDRNWQVCSQSPKPGRFNTERTITFNVVKNDESCSYRAPASIGGGGDEDNSSTSASGGSSSSDGASSSSSGGGTASGGSSADGASSGATALCNDGSLSYAAHHQGACSHHGGVAVFYK